MAPQDHGMRLLAAAAFAQIGLRTPALELLDLLPAEVARDASVVGLRGAAEAMPDDRIDAATSLAVARANAEALRARGVDLLPHLARWAERRAAEAWYTGGGGNIVRRVRGSWRAADWRGLADQRGAAAAFAARHLPDPANPAGPACQSTYTIEGVDPPWFLLELHRRTAPAGGSSGRSGFIDAFSPCLFVLQADPQEMLDGLAQADLREVLSDARVRVLAGPDAGERFGELLRERLDFHITGAFIPLSGLRTRLAPSPGRILEEAEAAQLREHERLAARVRATYEARDRAWWAARYERALAGRSAPGDAGAPCADGPLRVLVLSCRYTTYIRHAAEDLAEAFAAAGCRTRVLLEPDAQARFSSVSYLRALDGFEPDLIVLANYTRATLGPWLPRSLPFVCWLQDAMPHQFDARAGAAQGEMDFLVGHVHAELHERFGYPRERSLQFPVVAGSRKFHAGAVDPELARRFECEIALVSHHSETPEAMHERLVREGGTSPQVARLLEALRPRVEEAVGLACVHGPLNLLRHYALLTARDVLGAEPDAKLLTTLYRHYALPLADRILRHEAVAWAARIAERRGWRLHLYGRGWEHHPRFAPHARGPVEHGEALRACYRSAAAHLHVSVNTLVHQRVLECALSGGLPLARLTSDAFGPSLHRAGAALRAAAGPVACSLEHQRDGYRIVDAPESLAWASLRQRCGLDAEPILWDWTPDAPPPPPERDPAWVLGDLGEVGFTDAASLERAMEHAVENPGWRGAMSGWIARRARERLTHDAFAARILGLVSGTLPRA